MPKLSRFTRGAIAGGGLMILAITDVHVLLDAIPYATTSGNTYTDKPCGDLIAQPYERVGDQYRANIRIATKSGLQEFPFTWPVERTDLTRTVENAITEHAKDRMQRRALSGRELYSLQQSPLGWLEVTCEEGKEPCQATALRSTCWGK